MVGSCTRIMAKKKLLLSFEEEEDTRVASLIRVYLLIIILTLSPNCKYVVTWYSSTVYQFLTLQS